MFNLKISVKKLSLIIALGFFSFSAFAQKRSHVLYAELGGNTLFYSANYDVRFAKSAKGLGCRVGISPTTDGFYYTGQLNFVTGEKHALEIGAGILSGYDKDVPYDIIPNACVMYRFQANRHFNFRIGWTPSFTPKSNDNNAYLESNQLRMWGGLSLGYRF